MTEQQQAEARPRAKSQVERDREMLLIIASLLCVVMTGNENARAALERDLLKATRDSFLEA